MRVLSAERGLLERSYRRQTVRRSCGGDLLRHESRAAHTKSGQPVGNPSSTDTSMTRRLCP